MKHAQALSSLNLGLLIGLALCALYLLGAFSHLGGQLTDPLYGGDGAHEDILIVTIDDKSLQEIGRWPWDRTIMAQLLPKLQGASVIGIDIAYFEPSTPEDDLALANALRESGNVILPLEFTSFTHGQDLRGEHYLRPLPELEEAAAGVGYINVITDADGITRSVNTQLSGKHSSFAARIAREHLGHNPDLGGERFLINFAGAPGSHTTHSFTDILHGRTDPDVSGKIVLIGASAPDLHDNYFVPTSKGKAMSGVEVHANAISTLLTGDTLTPASKESTLLIILAASAFSVLIVASLPLWVCVPLVLLALVAYAFTGIFAFDSGIVMDFIYPPSALIIGSVASVAQRYNQERKAKRYILGAFSKYVAKDVIDDLLEHPEKLKLGGERTEITVFFSDIRGFTSISEALSPEDLVRLLNEYLSEMTSIIIKNKGVVDKYMGDAIMAFWGAPVPHHDHAKLAAKSVLEMNQRLAQLQKEWSARGVPPLAIGSGLNTGPAVVGNMGSYERFDYTAMGDTVNLGSRLEGLNKQYGTTIIISESTKKLLEDEYTCRKLDAVQVKGKHEPVIIYELVERKEKVDAKRLDAIQHFEEGLEHYLSQRFETAIRSFKKAGEDKAAQLFIERCRAFKKNPPGKEWKGVWVMTTK